MTPPLVLPPGQHGAGAGGPGGRVPVPVRAAGRAEGRHGDQNQAGARQPHLRAAGEPPCPPPPQTRTHKGGGLPVTPLPPCPLQTQLAACAKALESSEELLETANQTLQTANNHDFIEVSPSAPTGAGLCPHPAVPGGGTGAAPCTPPPPPPLPVLLGTFFSFFCAGHCDDAALAAPAVGLG